MNKIILLATFLKKENIKAYVENLTNKHGVINKEIYTYEIEDNLNFLIVFKYTYPEYEGKNFKDKFKETFIVHKKSDTIYTINALNGIIEKNNKNKIGNIDYKTIKINWLEYKNNLLMVKNNQLKISTINRIFEC